jgi:hypothetical protein
MLEDQSVSDQEAEVIPDEVDLSTLITGDASRSRDDLSYEALVKRLRQDASGGLAADGYRDTCQDGRLVPPMSAPNKDDSSVRPREGSELLAIITDESLLQVARLRECVCPYVSIERESLVDLGRGVQLLHEPRVGVVSLAAGGEAAERPDDDRERERQEQQSGRQPQASPRAGCYRLPPP